MNSFKSMIGGDAESIKNTRVTNFTNTAVAESKILIESLKNKYRNIQNEIEGYLDLGAETTTDIATNLKNINANKLFTDLYSAADKLSVIARQIKIRVSIHNRLFPDDTVKDLTKAELDFLEFLYK